MGVGEGCHHSGQFEMVALQSSLQFQRSIPGTPVYSLQQSRLKIRSKRNRAGTWKGSTKYRPGRTARQPFQLTMKERKLEEELKHGNDEKKDNSIGDSKGSQKEKYVEMSSFELFKQVSFPQGYSCKGSVGMNEELQKNEVGSNKNGTLKPTKTDMIVEIDVDRKCDISEKRELVKTSKRPEKDTKNDQNEKLKVSDGKYMSMPDQNSAFHKLQAKKLVKLYQSEKFKSDMGNVHGTRKFRAVESGQTEIIDLARKNIDVNAQLQACEFGSTRQGMDKKEELRVSLDGVRLRGELECCASLCDKEVGLMALDNRYAAESELPENEETTVKKCLDPLKGYDNEKEDLEKEKESGSSGKESDCSGKKERDCSGKKERDCADKKESGSDNEKEGDCNGEKERDYTVKEDWDSCHKDQTYSGAVKMPKAEPVVMYSYPREGFDDERHRSVDEDDEGELIGEGILGEGELDSTKGTENSCDFPDTYHVSTDSDETQKSRSFMVDWNDNRTVSTGDLWNATEKEVEAKMDKESSMVANKEKDIEMDEAMKEALDLDQMKTRVYLRLTKLRQDNDSWMEERYRQLTEAFHTFKKLLSEFVQIESEDRFEKLIEKEVKDVTEEKEQGINEEDGLEDVQKEQELSMTDTDTEKQIDHTKEADEMNEISVEEDDDDKDVDDEKKDVGDEKWKMENSRERNKESHRRNEGRGREKHCKESKKEMKTFGKPKEFRETLTQKMERYMNREKDQSGNSPELQQSNQGLPELWSFNKGQSGKKDGNSGKGGRGHLVFLGKVKRIRPGGRLECTAKVRKKRFDRIPKLRSGYRRLKQLDGGPECYRKCSGHSGSAQGGSPTDRGGKKDGYDSRDNRGKRDDKEQNSENNQNSGNGPGDGGNGGRRGSGYSTEPTRDPMSVTVPEQDPKRYRKKHWKDGMLDMAHFLGDLMKKIKDRGGPLCEMDDVRIQFCVTECLTRLDMTEDMMSCEACIIINSLLKHYANCAAPYNDCTMCVQIFSLICIHVSSCIANDTVIYCEVKLCSNIAMNYEGCDLSVHLKMLWLHCRKKLARIIGSEELGLVDIPEDHVVPSDQLQPNKRSSRVLARKRSGLSDVAEQGQEDAALESVRSEVHVNVPPPDVHSSLISGLPSMPSTDTDRERLIQGLKSLPVGPPRGVAMLQYPSLEDRPVGIKGIGEVVYKDKHQMILVACHWDTLKAKYQEERTLTKHYREEGVILSRYEDLLKIEGLRYNIDYQWVKVTHLGNGMSGKCHLAKDFNTDFKFCVKEIHISNYEKEEIELWTELDHPNIVQIYGAIRHGEKIYIFQELIEGGCLTEAINEQKALGRRLSQRTALRFFQQLLQVLVYLRSKNILHEDLKADNILLHKNKELVSIKLADFGLAQRCPHMIPKGTKPVGTQTQWSPEKAEGVGYGFPAEVWASVCVLVHMLSGSPPWMARYEMLKALIVVIVEKSPPLEDIPRNILDTIRDLIERGFTVCAGERPTAEKLLLHSAFRILENRENSHETVVYSMLGNQRPTTQSITGDNETLLGILRDLDAKPQRPEPQSSVHDSIQRRLSDDLGATGGDVSIKIRETGRNTNGDGFQRNSARYSSSRLTQERPSYPDNNTDPKDLYERFISDNAVPVVEARYGGHLALYNPDEAGNSSSGSNSMGSSETTLTEKLLPDFPQLGINNLAEFVAGSDEKDRKIEDEPENDEDMFKDFDIYNALRTMGLTADNREDTESTDQKIPDVVTSQSMNDSIPNDDSQENEGAGLDFPDDPRAMQIESRDFDPVQISNDDALFQSGSLDDSIASAARSFQNQLSTSDVTSLAEAPQVAQYPQASSTGRTGLQWTPSLSATSAQNTSSVRQEIPFTSNVQAGSDRLPAGYIRPLTASPTHLLHNTQYGNPNHGQSGPVLGRSGPTSMQQYPNVTYQRHHGFHTSASNQMGSPNVNTVNRPWDDPRAARAEIRDTNMNAMPERHAYSMQPYVQSEVRLPVSRSLFPGEVKERYGDISATNPSTNIGTAGNQNTMIGATGNPSANIGTPGITSTFGTPGIPSSITGISGPPTDRQNFSSALKPGRVNVKEGNNAINEMMKEQMKYATSSSSAHFQIGDMPMFVRVDPSVSSANHWTEHDRSNLGAEAATHGPIRPPLTINTTQARMQSPTLSHSKTAPVLYSPLTPSQLVPTTEFNRSQSYYQTPARQSDSSMSSMSPHSQRQMSTPRSQFDEQEEMLGFLKKSFEEAHSQHSDSAADFMIEDDDDDYDNQVNAEFDFDMENPAASLPAYVINPEHSASYITVVFKSPVNGANMRMNFQPKYHDWSWKRIVEEELSRMTSKMQEKFGLNRFCLKWENGAAVDLDSPLGRANVTVFVHPADSTEGWVVDNGNILV